MAQGIRLKLSDELAIHIGLTPIPSQAYSLSESQHIKALKYKAVHGKHKGGERSSAIKVLKTKYNIDIDASDPLEVEVKTDTDTNQYDNKKDDGIEDVFRKCSAWREDGKIMNIDEYCERYGFPREDVHSYKLVSHTGTPYWNIAFKENLGEEEAKEFDFDAIFDRIAEKYEPQELIHIADRPDTNDFDVLTYSDLHIGMEPDMKGNALYPTTWTPDDIMGLCTDMIAETISEQKSRILIVDELGDFLDGLNGLTTRGGHGLPQVLSNEECFDLGMEFKCALAHGLSPYYDSIIFNNICNDNHSGIFAYVLNQGFKKYAESVIENIEVHNYQKFFSHYEMGEFLFIITHGKDEEFKKFGLAVNPKPKDLSSLDGYIKANDLYKKGKSIILKKGDSHQALFDMCSSDDFWYFNYPSAAPSSQWIQTNFQKGRRGFINESFRGRKNYMMPYFY